MTYVLTALFFFNIFVWFAFAHRHRMLEEKINERFGVIDAGFAGIDKQLSDQGEELQAVASIQMAEQRKARSSSKHTQ